MFNARVLATVLAMTSFIYAEEVVIYSGRSRSLVAPLVKRIEAKTGVKVTMRYGKTAHLAMLLMEEGEHSPADIFWAQDAGALSALAQKGKLAPLPKSLLEKVPVAFRDSGGRWVATSGRARVLAYSKRRVDTADLPKSVFELTDPKWKGLVGWAPTNGSFQAFVTAMRAREGEEKTRKWLKAMIANGTKAYAKNTPILQALAAGEIDIGLPNHYYLLRFLASDPEFPVAQTVFQAGDIGNLVNVAGAAVRKGSKKSAAAQKVIEFLLSPEAQGYFTEKVFEYPVANGAVANKKLLPMDEMQKNAASIDLNVLKDLAGTLELMRDVGLL
ncbi:MAG: iron ABC transporter substrate-binding protein [Planctomycetota bacterium]